MLKNIMLFFLLLFSFIACEDFFQTAVELELEDDGNRIVLNCIYHPDTHFMVGIERSKGILESNGGSRILPDVTVDLYGNGIWLETLHRDSLARHEFPFSDDYPIENPDRHPSYLELQSIPNPNVNYTIKVASTGFETVEATNYIPEPVGIKNAYLSDSILTNRHDRTVPSEYEVTIEFEDDPAISNYYHLRLITNQFEKERLMDSSGVLILDHLGNPIFTGQEQHSIHWGSFYTSDSSFEREENNVLNPTELDAPMNTYFQRETAFFSDHLFNGTTKQLKIWAPASHIKRHSNTYYRYQSYIELGTISEDLYRYVYSLERHRPTTEDPFAERSPVYNNIEKGIGIFGGYSVYRYEIINN